jgi:curved DNA-binding protein CbpA
VPRGPPGDPFAEPHLQSPREREDLLPEAELMPRASSGRRSSPAASQEDALARLDSLSLDEDSSPAAPPPAQEESLEIDRRPRHGARAGGSTASHAREEPTFDHALQPEPSAPGDERARELRKKMLARGMRNLGSMSPPQKEPQGGAAEGAPPLPLDESQLSPEDLRYVDDVRSRAKMALTQSAYARLGVPPTASLEQIKSSFLGLAKRFHPDRSGAPGLAGLQPELQSLFGQLKDAYDNISNAEQRARYDAELKVAGPKRSSRKDEAGLALKMGEVLLKKRDFEGAINKLRRSVDLEPTGDALAALAWSLVADPKSSAQSKEEAASLINRALRAPGVTARTYYVAGVLWRTKDPDSAVDAFRKALEVDPQHSDAALELRLIEQRRGKEKKSGGGVLSGLLFGKRKS